MEINLEEIRELLQLDDISDRFGYERGFEFFFKGWVIGFVKFSDLACNSDDKREGPFKKEDDGGYLCKDISPWTIKDSGFVQDFEIFFHGAVCSF